MEYKQTQQLSPFNVGERKITGIASHTGLPVDRDGDIFAKGAFDKFLRDFEVNGKVKLIDGHGKTGGETIGKVTKFWMEDNRLMFEASISSAPSADDIYIKLKEGVLDQVSIGFMGTGAKYLNDGTREIQQAEIFELSVVPIPANGEANILSVKAKKEEPTTKTSEASEDGVNVSSAKAELYKQHLINKQRLIENRSKNNEQGQ